MISAAALLDEEANLDLGEKGVAGAPIARSFKLQAPHHLTVGMLGEVPKDLVERRTRLHVPAVDAAIRVGEGGKRRGRAERFQERERDRE